MGIFINLNAMEEKLYNYRKFYGKDVLSEKLIDNNPMQQFRTWFFEVRDSETVDEVNAMTISTIGIDGFPKGRVVLLKKYDEWGFYFYTNYNSEKGRAITINNNVSLSFYWAKMERQIIIKGKAERTSEADSANYFHSRPKGSQLGALVSTQSTPIDSREVLERKLKELERQYENQEIPKPEDWGGILVRPMSMEFWQGRPNRLHDRIRYTLKDQDWIIERLAP